MIWLSLIAFLTAAIAAGAVIRFARHHARQYGHDMPQRFHHGHVPRLGGLAIVLGMGLSWLLGIASTLWGDPASLRMGEWAVFWLIALLPSACGGIAEDITQRLSVRYRLLLTALSGLLAVLLLQLRVTELDIPWIDQYLLQPLPWLGIGIALLAVAGLPHAFNIIDGYNGLAGMVALIICLALAHVALQVGDRTLAALLLSTAAATGGFLLWNYPRGLLFAGDGGAYIWGTVIAMACLYLVQRNAGISPWFPVLLLIYPIWETCFSAYRKLARGVSPGVADALHFHQLIYRRIVRRTFDEDIARRMLKRNNRTSPYLWAFTLLTVGPAVIFRGNTAVLMALCLLFVACYVLAYLAIIRFKVPGWFQP